MAASEFIPSGLRQHWPLALVLLAGGLAYLSPLVQHGWISDDYIQVFGTDLTPVPTLGRALSFGGNRLLLFPFIGFLGRLLGASGAHLLQAMMHLATAALFYALLFRVRWKPRWAALAAVIFAVSPWVSSAVLWWSAIGYPASSIFMLCSAHMYLSWLRGCALRIGVLLGAMASVLLGLFFNELWAAGFLVFCAIGLLEPRDTKKGGAARCSHALKEAAPMLLPYLAYALLAVSVLRPTVHKPHLTLQRVPIVFASIHLRMYHWLVDTPWVSATRSALTALGWVGSFMLVALLVAVYMLVFKAMEDDAQIRDSKRVAFLPSLILAWAFFLGSRLVLILMGGTSTVTRLNYGAAMGVSIALALMLRRLSGLCHTRYLRRVTAGSIAVVCTILVLTCVGIGIHYRKTSEAEELTVRILKPLLASYGAGRTLIILGDPTGTKGEFSYFEEESGLWLRERLRVREHGLNAYVVPTERVLSGFVRLTVAERGKWRTITLPAENCIVYSWQNGELKLADSRNLSTSVTN